MIYISLYLVKPFEIFHFKVDILRKSRRIGILSMSALKVQNNRIHIISEWPSYNKLIRNPSHLFYWTNNVLKFGRYLQWHARKTKTKFSHLSWQPNMKWRDINSNKESSSVLKCFCSGTKLIFFLRMMYLELEAFRHSTDKNLHLSISNV